ncbi:MULTISPECIES: NAD(P)-dependent oxidoreductase [Streptomyces]|uniref:NAD(P)-dependent oxidoreductase n=1 Tax=unclassified Streptomyces TaxID=2593676 RepID=UPI00088F5A59|nr:MULTISPECIES: NAD(P)-dependent oxidoreductase [unclassified Streptomyces]MDX2731313.1 NAD(P)-dependent oxidoreductase [Streptomyces sp. PA03-2a]MDX3767117.1 NAD(P)-dependent oxidoreductase [Streptomyces sp. AK08-01B]MDX3817105.1 NAD(P)-dependent oxidoreductase [Streptomyces sp. AK08-01A]SCZ01085.1 3-hydroxyisobutyrate dehydrogenase [Streptomyces sp. 136MFCol5.1]SFT07511.1 3-hydroxyisobutyrate dehydrogenase [Streptomyces sp. ok210]
MPAENSPSTPTAAVLGLGAMGLPMATRLAGVFPVRAFDVFEERRALAAKAGATPAATPADAAQGADVVVIAVRDQEQLDSCLFGGGIVEHGAAESLREGAVVVVTSTVGVDGVQYVAARLAEQGVRLVDAPVSGGSVRAGTGDLLIMVGADDAALAAAQPVLGRLASTLHVVGPRIGDGQIMKTVNQLLCGIHTAAAAESLALARALGIDLDRAVDVLGQGAAASFMLADRGPRMVQQYEVKGDGTGGPELRSRLDIIRKDMNIVVSLAKKAGVATSVAAAADQLYQLAISQGLAAADDSALITLLSPRTAL